MITPDHITLELIVDALANAVAAKLKRDASAPALQPRLLTVEQAATYLGRTKEAVEHMVAKRRLPVVRDGRRVFLDVKELDRWIATNTEPAQF